MMIIMIIILIMLVIQLIVMSILLYLHAGVATGFCEKTLLRIRRPVGNSPLKTPNLGLDCSFCCWVVWPRLK